MRKTGAAHITDSGRAILSQMIVHVSDDLKKEAQENCSRPNKKLLLSASYRLRKDKAYHCWDTMAYIGMTEVLNGVFSSNPSNKKYTNIAITMGKKLESEQRIQLFSQYKPDLHHIIKHADLVRPEESRDVYINWEKEIGEWEDWSKGKHLKIGAIIIQSILALLPDYFILNTTSVKGSFKKAYIVDSTAALREFIHSCEENVISSMSSGQPCIEPPKHWVVGEDKKIKGGFHTPEMSSGTPFVIIKTAVQKQFLKENIPYKHIEAVNYMQQVQWEINPDGVELLELALRTGMFKEVPCIYKIEVGEKPDDSSIEARKAWGRDAMIAYAQNEKNSRAIVAIRNILSTAKVLRDKPIWFVYNTCFRGRIYCSSGTLSTQGRDYVKAMLRFREGKVLGDAGLKWLAVHGANKYGYNKVSYTDRYKWVMDNMDSIREVASHPNSSRGRSFLRGADKPFQFYTFCREWAHAHKLKDPATFVSHLPVALDGSSNGFQHIFAMLRDMGGAARVNLLKSALPEDVYRKVHTGVIKLLTDDTDNILAINLLRGGIEKKVIKGVVLTIPYGVTQKGMSTSIATYIMDNIEKFPEAREVKVLWKMSNYLKDQILIASKELVSRIQELLQWFKDVGNITVDAQKHIKWCSPVGFPIHQQYVKYDHRIVRVHTRSKKRMNLQVNNPNKELSRIKTKAALLPNLVHSLDSSHVVMTALEAKAKGIKSINFIHDDYATHAADTPTLFLITRCAFAELYCADNLGDFREQVSKNLNLALPPTPAYGEYDASRVVEAPYFFS